MLGIAIWGEDWSNNASTCHCGAYNVDLMRAAMRGEDVHLGHYLIAYANRKPFDIRLKAVSEVARGVMALHRYRYGPMWITRDRSAWQSRPEVWKDHTALIREIGAMEDMLLPAQPRKAEVALLYSSASDIWTVKRNLSYGFDQMNNWLALDHAQVPVDIVYEAAVADGDLSGYKVCYKRHELKP